MNSIPTRNSKKFGAEAFCLIFALLKQKTGIVLKLLSDTVAHLVVHPDFMGRAPGESSFEIKF